MGNITLSLEDKQEEKLRRIAKHKYGGKKGSMSKVVGEAIAKLEEDEKRERAKQSLLRKLSTGFEMGKILYKNRAELHER